MVLLNNQNFGSNLDNFLGNIELIWILDSGCSHHMKGRKDFLKNLKHVSPYVIGLPNGFEAVATQQGNVSLGLSFWVHNMLFIHKLKCSLISLAQLMRESNFFVTIFNPFFVI